MATRRAKNASADKAQTETIKALKGFDPDFKCRGVQYEVGKTYTHDGPVEVCESGFHACEGSPFDVWRYYGPVSDDGRLTRYADVTMSGVVRDPEQSDSKVAAATITIDAELRFPDFVRRAVAWVIDATKGNGDDPGGYDAQIGSIGDFAQIGSIGDFAQIGSSGNGAQIGSSGYGARIGSSGHGVRIGSSGGCAMIGSSGDGALIVAEGKNAVIACAGSAIVTAGEGGAFCIPYHDGKRTRFAVGYVGEDGIKPGVAYTVKDGKLVEA